jgi:hypothetical protein
MSNIFQRDETDGVRVPRIEVQGERVRVQGNPDEASPDTGEADPQGQNQSARDYRLPKTKWF